MRRDVLLLQGPVGPFFARFAEGLEARGFRVWKVNFNGGDRIFYRRPRALDFSGKLEEWEAHLERLIVNRNIGRIYLFGDCRAYHRVAREVAKRNGVRVFVFEEGYIRPNFVTLEEGGVNGYSSLMEKPINLFSQDGPLPTEHSVPSGTFRFAAVFSMIYYWACALHQARYPYYRHHRPLGWFSEGIRWIRSGLRRIRYQVRERGMLNELLPHFEGNYFVCPLQVHCDMQVVVHSDYNSIEHFIGDVLASFAQHAPSNKALVFKHHPMDRAYTDYTAVIANLSAELGIADRVYYVHDVDLPTLLRHAQGTVLINSTVGVSSLFHRTPVKTLGRAVYDLDGLTSQRPLAEFWQRRESVDGEAFENFRANLMLHNQLNASFFRRLSSHNAAGIVWAARLLEQHSYDAHRPERVDRPTFSVVEGTGGIVAGGQVIKQGDRAA